MIADADRLALFFVLSAWVCFSAAVWCLYHTVESPWPSQLVKDIMLIAGIVAGTLHVISASSQMALVGLAERLPEPSVWLWGSAEIMTAVASTSNSVFIFALGLLLWRPTLHRRFATLLAFTAAMGTSAGVWFASVPFAWLGALAFVAVVLVAASIAPRVGTIGSVTA